MRRNRRSILLLALGAAGMALASCSSGTSSNPQAARTAAQAANAGNFSTVYFIGDSLTAGYQSGSLISSSQPNGWAPLVAKQAAFQSRCR